MPGQTKSIVAYFVGIGAYPNKDHVLIAPPGDVDLMEEIIEAASKRSKMPLVKKTLIDADAKRSDVISGFEIFKDLHPEDICLFYYSGHGSRIHAPYFINESEGLTNSIVCQDSRTEDGDDLADKELAYLLKSTFSGHPSNVVLIMDCCHAGGNSRSAYVRNKMADPGEEPRAFNTFLGHETFESFDTNSGVRYSIAPAPHLHLAACAPDESAKEMEFDGEPKSVFTHFIYEALTKENQKMSYAQLMAEVRLRTEQYVSFQTPEIQTVGGLSTQQKNRFFLEGAWQAGTTSYFIYPENNGWFVNAGFIDGVSENDYAIIPNDNEKYPVLEPMIQKSKIGNAFGLDPTESHECTIKKSLESHFCFAPIDWKESGFNESIKAYLSESKSQDWRYSENTSEVSHFISKNEIHLQVIKKDDYDESKEHQPAIILEQKIDPNDWPKTATSVALRLDQWAQFHRVLNQRNPYSEIDFEAIEIQIRLKAAVAGGTWNEPIEIKKEDFDQPIVLPQFDGNEVAHCSELSLTVFNHSNLPLWVSGLVLGPGFNDVLETSTQWSITNTFLQSEKIEKDGGHKSMLDYYDGQTLQFIPFFLDEDYMNAVGKEAISYIQIWIATEPFITDRMNQTGVPISLDFMDISRSARKVLDEFEPDWQVFTVPLKIVKQD